MVSFEVGGEENVPGIPGAGGGGIELASEYFFSNRRSEYREAKASIHPWEARSNIWKEKHFVNKFGIACFLLVEMGILAFGELSDGNI